MDFAYDNQYGQLVRKVIRSLICKYEIAGYGFGFDEKDLFQEGCLALLKAEQTYNKQGKAKFETYASVVIANHVLDYIRVQKEAPMSFEVTQNEEVKKKEHSVEPPSKPEIDPVFREILREVLNKYCDKLERAIFNAHYKGYSYQEICEIFEINKKKVDNTIQKIYRMARDIYAH